MNFVSIPNGTVHADRGNEGNMPLEENLKEHINRAVNGISKDIKNHIKKAVEKPPFETQFELLMFKYETERNVLLAKLVQELFEDYCRNARPNLFPTLPVELPMSRELVDRFTLIIKKSSGDVLTEEEMLEHKQYRQEQMKRRDQLSQFFKLLKGQEKNWVELKNCEARNAILSDLKRVGVSKDIISELTELEVKIATLRFLTDGEIPLSFEPPADYLINTYVQQIQRQT